MSTEATFFVDMTDIFRTPWLTTRRRTCPICKGDVVRSLARANLAQGTSDGLSRLYEEDEQESLAIESTAAERMDQLRDELYELERLVKLADQTIKTGTEAKLNELKEKLEKYPLNTSFLGVAQEGGAKVQEPVKVAPP